MAFPHHTPIVRNKLYRPNGLKSYVYTMNKFGIKPTLPGPFQYHHNNKALVKMVGDGSSTAVGAEDQQNDSFYTCPVSIGTPAQIFHLDFDSGSSDLWVWSAQLSSTIQKKGKSTGVDIFHPDASSTFHDVSHASWKIAYGDGSGASGVVGTDVVQIGNISIKSQAVELATKLSEQFVGTGGSGLLGLAFGSINTVKPSPVKTPMDSMIEQGLIPADHQLFTVYLGSVKDMNDPDKGQSFYTFGSIDQEIIRAAEQELSYTPIDNSLGF